MLIWELLEGRADQCGCCAHDGACDHRHDADCGRAGANGDTQSSSTIDGERPPRQSSWHEAARINAGWNVVKAPKKPTAFKPAKRRKPRITKPMKPTPLIRASD